MTITHKEYLELMLRSKKYALDELNVSHRINIATYEAKKDMLFKEIHSIEMQLESEQSQSD